MTRSGRGQLAQPLLNAGGKGDMIGAGVGKTGGLNRLAERNRHRYPAGWSAAVAVPDEILVGQVGDQRATDAADQGWYDRSLVPDCEQTNAGSKRLELAGTGTGSFGKEYEGLAMLQQPRAASDCRCIAALAPYRPGVPGANEPGEPAPVAEQLLFGKEVNLAAGSQADEYWVNVGGMVGSEYLRPGPPESVAAGHTERNEQSRPGIDC